MSNQGMALLVDANACAEFPVLKEHYVGVDVSMLSSLLLPLARHRRLLDQLEKYVWARDAEAKFPSTINPTVDSSAFAVRYQKAAPSAMRAWQDMEDVRSEILKRCQENQARKRKEVEEKKLKHQELLETAEAKQDQAARLSCLYTDCSSANYGSEKVLMSKSVFTTWLFLLSLAKVGTAMKNVGRRGTAHPADDVASSKKPKTFSLKRPASRWIWVWMSFWGTGRWPLTRCPRKTYFWSLRPQSVIKDTRHFTIDSKT